MLIVLFRSVVIVGLIMAYSVGVWQFINDYFGNEFKVYLERELKNDPYLKLTKNGTEITSFEFCDAVTMEDVFKFIGRGFCFKKDNWIDLWNYDKSSIIENSVNGFCSSENYKISC